MLNLNRLSNKCKVVFCFAVGVDQLNYGIINIHNYPVFGHGPPTTRLKNIHNTFNFR